MLTEPHQRELDELGLYLMAGAIASDEIPIPVGRGTEVASAIVEGLPERSLNEVHAAQLRARELREAAREIGIRSVKGWIEQEKLPPLPEFEDPIVAYEENPTGVMEEAGRWLESAGVESYLTKLIPPEEVRDGVSETAQG